MQNEREKVPVMKHEMMKLIEILVRYQMEILIMIEIVNLLER